MTAHRGLPFLGRYQASPYQYAIRDNNYPVNVIRHNAKHTKHHIREPFRQPLPSAPHHPPNVLQPHVPIEHPTRETDRVLRADGDEIYSRPTVVAPRRRVLWR
jgi:hypothetical protein